MGAVLMSAVTLAACSPQAAAPTTSILKDIGPVKAADVVPELNSALRSQLKHDPGAGVDAPAVYAVIDKHMVPLITDFQARLAKAPKQIGTAPGPIVKASAAHSASQASLAPGPIVKGSSARAAGPASLARMGEDVPGREYIVNTTHDAGDQWNSGDIISNVKGVSEVYVENGEVVIHLDMTGEATKSTGAPGTTDQTVQSDSLLIGERVDKDGHKTGRKTSVDLCPDAAGLSHGKLYFQMVAGIHIDGPAGQRSGQSTFIVTADLLGHVDDSATLTSYDLNNLSFQRSATGSGSSDSMGFFADGISLTGVAPASPEGNAWTSGGKVVAGPSARTRIHNMKEADAQREIGLMVIFAKLHAEAMYQIAEKTWQHGYCVKLAATKGPDPKRLAPGQTTRFTIEVFHKPDNAKLDVPVIATARNGKVAPEGKVMPPAKFTFKAADGKPTSYGVSLKSTSRRGIGELALGFSQQGYKLKIVLHISGGGPPPNVATITGTVLPDPSGSFLVGPGIAQAHLYANPELGCPGNWRDLGLQTYSVELKGIDKGDGTLEVQATATGASTELLGTSPFPLVTFPIGNGDRAVASGSSTTTDECTAVDGLITLTTITSWTVEAGPVTG